MKNNFKSRSVTRSIMALFTPDKGVNPHTRYPDEYYGRVAFNKQMFDGIELIAKIERTTKKKAARLLLEEGFKNYIGQKLREDIKVEIAAEELRQKPEATRFIIELRKFAKERGMKIDPERKRISLSMRSDASPPGQPGSDT
jgi:predicted house-cleaning noncanonical NTP pyrophosphatase (MazG superfamily)